MRRCCGAKRCCSRCSGPPWRCFSPIRRSARPPNLPQLRLVFDTCIVLAASLVAVLAGIRFTLEARRLELLLLAGFATGAAGAFAFSVLPAFDGEAVGRARVGPPSAPGSSRAR